MKRLVMILAVLLIGVSAFAQGRGSVGTITTDTVKGNENVTFGPISLTGGYGSLFISATITRVSTAAGGTLFLKTGLASASSLVVNQTTNPNLAAAPNDTLATADVATQYWNLEIDDPAASKYYILADGDANDTIIVAISYMYK